MEVQNTYRGSDASALKQYEEYCADDESKDTAQLARDCVSDYLMGYSNLNQVKDIEKNMKGLVEFKGSLNFARTIVNTAQGESYEHLFLHRQSESTNRRQPESTSSVDII